MTECAAVCRHLCFGIEHPIPVETVAEDVPLCAFDARFSNRLSGKSRKRPGSQDLRNQLGLIFSIASRACMFPIRAEYDYADIFLRRQADVAGQLPESLRRAARSWRKPIRTERLRMTNGTRSPTRSSSWMRRQVKLSVKAMRRIARCFPGFLYRGDDANK